MKDLTLFRLKARSWPKMPYEHSSSICTLLRYIAIRIYTSLCGRREDPRMRRRLQHNSRNQSESLDSRDTTDSKPCFPHLEPDIYPMRCPGTQCLFCLGDVSLAPKIRTRCFAKPFTLTRHVHNQHLQYRSAGQPFNCRHPPCTVDGVFPKDPNHYKNHALREHSITHSA